MRDDPSKEAVIRRYLLGDLPEDLQLEIEERAFEDQQYTLAIEEAENDLIDEYIQGGMSERERRQFESLFFNSAERRRKLKFARTLSLMSEKECKQ